jgi:hypothetical protein
MSTTLATTAVSIVLVHGGFVDGSGWQGVYEILKKDGYNVSIVQNPTTSLADDVAATKRILSTLSGPATARYGPDTRYSARSIAHGIPVIRDFILRWRRSAGASDLSTSR